MKHLILLLLLCAITSCSKQQTPQQLYSKMIKDKASVAQQYVEEHNLNDSYCLLVDYGLPSGKPRVFVWSFKDKKVIYKAHTMHGSGRNSTNERAEYSNVLGSNCSALGHFAITHTHGRINPDGFRLKGLDKANKNAWDRALMLHDSYWVDEHLGEKYIPINSIYCQGCVTIATKELETISPLINESSKLLLLWTFDSTLNS